VANPPPLSSVRIAGYTSIADLRLELNTDVTVLVGPNGAGKSNIISALELLGRVVDGQTQEFLLGHGGLSALRRRAPRDSISETIVVEVTGGPDDQLRNGYRVELRPARGDVAFVKEQVSFHAVGSYEKPYTRELAVGEESRLRAAQSSGDNTIAGIARHVLPLIEGCRVFHFHDTSSDAPVKRLVDEADNLSLAPDARNLAPLLARLLREAPPTYERIVRAVQTVAPYFADFVLRTESGRLRLRWRERGLDEVFSADELSDGTLRFICLATLLLQPDRPGTVVLDEPELGLHPFAVHQLCALITAGAQGGRRVLLATQSVTLVSQFEPEELAVVERGPLGTRVHRWQTDELSDWLEEYSLGELWEKNRLGGRPGPDTDPHDFIRGG
jgi:predicted ATPase